MVAGALSLQWKLPVGVFLTLLILGLLILFLLRFFSVVPDRYIRVGMKALIGGCLLGLGLSWVLHRPPPLVHRLAIFPPGPVSAEDRHAGLGYGLAHLATDLLRKNLPENVRITPFDIVESVSPDTTMLDAGSLRRVCAQVGAQYAVTGTWHIDTDSAWIFQARFFNFLDGEEARQDFRFAADSLAYAPYALNQAVRQHMPVLGAVSPERPTFSSAMFAHYSRGQALFRLGTSDGFWEASEAYRAVLTIDSTWAWPYYGLAQVYQAWQRPGAPNRIDNDVMNRKAVEYGKTALALHPRFAEAYRLTAFAYRAVREWDAESLALKQAIGMDPQDPWNYTELAQVRRERFQDFGFADEGKLCEQAIRLNPEALRLRVRLIYGYISAGNLLDAFTFAEEALALSPDDVDMLLATGEACLYYGRARQAVEVYTRALELAPDNYRTYIGTANAYSMQGQSDHAIETYERGIRTLPQRSELYYNLGVLHQRHGHWDKALPFFEQAIAIDDHVNSHYYLAKWFEKQGDRENAVKHWKQRVESGDPYEQWTKEAAQHLHALSTSALPSIGVSP